MTYIKFLKIIAILLFFCSFQQILTLSAQQTNSQNLTNNVCSIKNVSYDEQTKILSFSYNFNAVNSGDLFYLQIYYYLPQEKTPSPRYAANKTFPLGSSDSFKNKKFQIPLNGDVSLDFVYSFRTVIYNSATNTYYGEINCKNSISNLSNKNKFLVSPQVNDSKKCDVQNLTYNRQTGNLSYEYKFAPGVSWIIVTVRNNAGREIKQKNYNSSQGIENAKKGNIELKSKPNPNQVRVYTRVYKENQRAWSKPKLCDLTVSKNIRQRTKTARRIQERSNFQTTQTTKQAKRNNKVLSRVRRSRDRTSQPSRIYIDGFDSQEYLIRIVEEWTKEYLFSDKKNAPQFKYYNVEENNGVKRITMSKKPFVINSGKKTSALFPEIIATALKTLREKLKTSGLPVEQKREIIENFFTIDGGTKTNLYFSAITHKVTRETAIVPTIPIRNVQMMEDYNVNNRTNSFWISLLREGFFPRNLTHHYLAMHFLAGNEERIVETLPDLVATALTVDFDLSSSEFVNFMLGDTELSPSIRKIDLNIKNFGFNQEISKIKRSQIHPTLKDKRLVLKMLKDPAIKKTKEIYGDNLSLNYRGTLSEEPADGSNIEEMIGGKLIEADVLLSRRRLIDVNQSESPRLRSRLNNVFGCFQ